MGLFLRIVTNADCNLLFKWVNDESVRWNAFNTNKVKFEEHLNWFKNRIDSEECYIFICYDKQLPIGQIRIDNKQSKWVIDYSIDSKYRGNGYGTKILALLEKEILMKSIQVSTLIGEVKCSNIASQKSFEKNGYKKIQKEQYICYTKKL